MPAIKKKKKKKNEFFGFVKKNGNPLKTEKWHLWYQQNCKSRKLTKNTIISVRFILLPSRNTKVDASNLVSNLHAIICIILQDVDDKYDKKKHFAISGYL